MTWHNLINFSQWFFLTYFFVLNIGYIVLNLLSLTVLQRYMASKVLGNLPQIYTSLEPPISILVPAYNEESTIAASIRSMMQLDYPEYEIVVINDGSKDQTLEELKKEFALELFPEVYCNRIKGKSVHGIYRSTIQNNLRVIDKENGGKADALNVGINVSHYPLFCGVDADTILQRDSLKRVVHPFLEDHRVVATGGTIRVANGCEVDSGFLTKVGLPKNLLALIQVVEYLRAFLFGRLGWSAMSGLLIISGAFGVFRKDIVIKVGGYCTDTVGEDMELVVRIHRLMRQQRKPYKVVFLADPVAWTEVPEDIRTLQSQRIRWQHGLAESLIRNFSLMLSSNGGVPGWLAFPFMMLFEWFGPIFEVIGYVLMTIFFLTGLISGQAFVIFLFAVIGFGIMLSVSSLLLEEISFNLYKKPTHLLWLLFAILAENFGYRQLNSVWRLMGLLRWLTGRKNKWGEMKRMATWQKE